jgi:hypothetical protein
MQEEIRGAYNYALDGHSRLCLAALGRMNLEATS